MMLNVKKKGLNIFNYKLLWAKILSLDIKHQIRKTLNYLKIWTIIKNVETMSFEINMGVDYT